MADDFPPPTPKHVFTLFHADPDIVEVTVKWRDGSGGVYSRSDDDQRTLADDVHDGRYDHPAP